MTRLDEIRERAEKATEGPWEKRSAPHPDQDISKADYMASLLRPDFNMGSLMVVVHEYPDEYLVPAVTGDGPNSSANADFIAHAREDIPYLLTELTEARRLLKQCIVAADNMEVMTVELWRDIRAFLGYDRLKREES